MEPRVILAVCFVVVNIKLTRKQHSKVPLALPIYYLFIYLLPSPSQIY